MATEHFEKAPENQTPIFSGRGTLAYFPSDTPIKQRGRDQTISCAIFCGAGASLKDAEGKSLTPEITGYSLHGDGWILRIAGGGSYVFIPKEKSELSEVQQFQLIMLELIGDEAV